MVFCIQNGDFSTRIAGLYGSQPSSEVFACKTATFGSELQVSMGPSHHLWFCAFKTATEVLVSMGPSPQLRILHAKQRLLDQNYKSLWVPALTCGFCMQNSDFWTRITSLYGSQPSSVVFACKTASLGPELQVSMGPRPHLWFFALKTWILVPELQVSMGPSPHLGFCAFTTATLWPELMVSMGTRPDLSFCSFKTAWLAPEILVSMGPRPHQSFCAYKTTWLASESLDSMGPSTHFWFMHSKQRL